MLDLWYKRRLHMGPYYITRKKSRFGTPRSNLGVGYHVISSFIIIIRSLCLSPSFEFS